MLGQGLEHLGRPDHRRVRRFGQPQDFLLDFGQALAAEFHGEVSARDHQPERVAAQCRQQQFGQRLHPSGVFDLGDDAEMSSLAHAQLLEQQFQIGGRFDERQADHVRVSNDEIQVGEVLVGQRRQAEP